MKKKPLTKQEDANETKHGFHLVFGRTNYILMIAGLIVLAIGYIMLSGGGSDDPNVFNADMFDSRRLVVAPLIIVAGLVVEICAIMFRKKENNN